MAAPLSAQLLSATVEGAETNELFGSDVASIGDIDGDGVPEYIVGAPSTAVLTGRTGKAMVFSGKTHAVLFTADSATNGDAVGSGVAGAGDVNNDGTPDFLVGASQVNSFGPRHGYVRVFSGLDFSVIHQVDGTGSADLLGTSVAGVGDLNKDGWDDFAAGAPTATTVNGLSQSVVSGKVVVYSGKDKSVLATLKSQSAGDEFGATIAPMRDLDGDDYPEILVGVPGSDDNGVDAGQVVVISGKLFTTLFTVDGDNPADSLGVSLCDLGNVGGDAKPDFAAGSEFGNYVRVYSGADASTIRTHIGAGVDDGLGQSVAGPGDLDGDGVPDLLAGAHYPAPFGGLIGAGYVRAYSGSTGDELFTLNGTALGDYYGSSLAGLGDGNHDGVPEFAVGAFGAANAAAKRSGIVEVYRMLDDTLDSGAVTSISLSAGGTQTLSLDVGATRGNGKSYLILGSVSGSSPGLPIANLVVPVNLDAYTVGLLQSINRVPLLGAFGALDASGQATATVTIPAGFPSALSGLTLTHAFILADPIVQIPIFASNAVQVTLTL